MEASVRIRSRRGEALHGRVVRPDDVEDAPLVIVAHPWGSRADAPGF